MKCEICHNAEAAGVLNRKREDGSTEELYVCKACREKETSGKAAPKEKDGKADVKEIVSSGDPPPFVENFFKAALGLVEGIAEQEKDKKACPGCGRTWEEIKTLRRVGCPRCYRTFAERIRTEFLAGAYARLHTGEMPQSVTGAETRTYLERQLKAAVKRQHFEKAAEIRRKLNALATEKTDEGTAQK